MAQQREEALKRADVRAGEEAQLARMHARNVLQQQRCGLPFMQGVPTHC